MSFFKFKEKRCKDSSDIEYQLGDKTYRLFLILDNNDMRDISEIESKLGDRTVSNFSSAQNEIYVG